jgi:hypothetical protein
MSTWNQPVWGGGTGTTPGTKASLPPFPELYLRNFLNDGGILPSELTPLQRVVDSFTVAAGQIVFNLSKVSSQLFSPIVYWNSVPQYPTIDYSINNQTLYFSSGKTGDEVVVIYAS